MLHSVILTNRYIIYLNMRKPSDPRSKLASRLFEKGLTAQLPSLERPRVFSLQKPESTLTAKIVKAHRGSTRNQGADSHKGAVELPAVNTSSSFIEEFQEDQYKSMKSRIKTDIGEVTRHKKEGALAT